jgi:hypothetical protein
MKGPDGKQSVRLANVTLRDSVQGDGPVVVVGDMDLSEHVLGYKVDRTNMNMPPVLELRIAVGKVNEESAIVRPALVGVPN